MIRSMNREQIERAEAVAAKAERERKARRDRRDDEHAAIVAMSETQGWKKPASLATGVRPVKRARVRAQFTDAQMAIALRSLEKGGNNE
jgi:hypothetical protein